MWHAAIMGEKKNAYPILSRVGETDHLEDLGKSKAILVTGCGGP
jgi:hypothetical protein